MDPENLPKKSYKQLCRDMGLTVVNPQACHQASKLLEFQRDDVRSVASSSRPSFKCARHDFVHCFWCPSVSETSHWGNRFR